MSVAVDLQSVRQAVLTGFGARLFASGLREEPSVLVVLHDAVVAVAIGHEDVALRIPADVGRTTEGVLLRRRIRTEDRRDRALDGRRAMSEHHQKLSIGAE